jgi:hypothetical protein
LFKPNGPSQETLKNQFNIRLLVFRWGIPCSSAIALNYPQHKLMHYAQNKKFSPKNLLSMAQFNTSTQTLFSKVLRMN